MADAPNASASFLGQMAHIVARSPDAGPRSEFRVPGDDRDGYENLILLCANCHTLVDQQPGTYTVERLLQIRADHERWVREQLTPQERLVQAHVVPALVREAVHSTVLRVQQMPRFVFTAPCSLPEEAVRDRLRAVRTSLMLPFVLRAGSLVTFSDLLDPASPFRGALPDLAPVRHHSADWWANQDRSVWFVALLNRALNKLTGRRELHLDRAHGRYYFEPLPPLADGGRPRERLVGYRPLNVSRASRKVAWCPVSRRDGKPRGHWEHLAVGLRFHRVGAETWVLSIRPERRFSRDGYAPLRPKLTTARSTRRAAHAYNDVLLRDLQFWRDYLSDGTPRIILDFGGQSLIVDGQPVQVEVEWPGVPEDTKTFDNAEYEDDLFTLAAYLEALEPEHGDLQFEDSPALDPSGSSGSGA